MKRPSAPTQPNFGVRLFVAQRPSAVPYCPAGGGWATPTRRIRCDGALVLCLRIDGDYANRAAPVRKRFWHDRSLTRLSKYLPGSISTPHETHGTGLGPGVREPKVCSPAHVKDVFRPLPHGRGSDWLRDCAWGSDSGRSVYQGVLCTSGAVVTPGWLPRGCGVCAAERACIQSFTSALISFCMDGS